MSTTTSVNALLSRSAGSLADRLATLLEVLLVFAGIPLYIWRWQYTYPQAWLPLLAVILLSHIAQGDAPRALGHLAASAGSRKIPDCRPLAPSVIHNMRVSPHYLFSWDARAEPKGAASGAKGLVSLEGRT